MKKQIQKFDEKYAIMDESMNFKCFLRFIFHNFFSHHIKFLI